MNIMQKCAAVAAALAVVTSCAAASRIERRFTASADTQVPGISLVVDSIDYRGDLTRVYGRIIGRPHTSNRIDSLYLTPAGGAVLEATDIDGVDMRRYFQWEDNGEIGLEIDFPAIKKRPAEMEMRAVTVKGPVVWIIKRRK